MKVEHIQIYAFNGNPIRKVTKVTRDDGRVIVYAEKLSKKVAVREAERAPEWHWEKDKRMAGEPEFHWADGEWKRNSDEL